jgi:hypothetical protein
MYAVMRLTNQYVLAALLLGLGLISPSTAQEKLQPLQGSVIGGAVGQDARPFEGKSELVSPLIDGDRSGFATGWTNNFCLRWTDDCSTCSREEVWDPIRCEPHEDRACRPAPVRCEVPDYAALNLSCERYGADCNVYSAWLENPDGGAGVGTRKGCLSTRKDYRCFEDWAAYERQNCQSVAPLDDQQKCQKILALVRAGRAARPKIAFPGLNR